MFRSLPFFWVIELFLLFGVGGDLLSHNLPVAVPSACAGLASGFGMGPGVSPPLSTTDTSIWGVHDVSVCIWLCDCVGVVSVTAQWTRWIVFLSCFVFGCLVFCTLG